jgi:hypothetical protein
VVDAFAVVLLGGLAVVVVTVWLLGRFYPGSGLEELGLRSAREITETRESLEAEDVSQMIAARNARRRARGEPEVTLADYELLVAQDLAEQQRQRERYLADRELDQLLEVTNARRRARGLPERTRAQALEELGGQRSGGGDREARRGPGAESSRGLRPEPSGELDGEPSGDA